MDGRGSGVSLVSGSRFRLSALGGSGLLLLRYQDGQAEGAAELAFEYRGLLAILVCLKARHAWCINLTG